MDDIYKTSFRNCFDLPAQPKVDIKQIRQNENDKDRCQREMEVWDFICHKGRVNK